MMKNSLNKWDKLIISTFVLACFISYPIAHGVAEEKAPPTIEQLARGEGGGWLPPTIEELTQGKVKIGDLITKDNVDLVKEYLPLTVYECVKKGMVLIMRENRPPEKITPKHFWEATASNLGKAVMDESGTVRLKDGSPWPGGLPFPDPKTPLEAMANVKFGHSMDDAYLPQSPTLYVSKEGKIEKEANMKIWQVYATSRTKVPPLGTVPGFEDFQWRHIAAFTEPLEMKGMGQLTIRHYDEYKNPDEGFLYLPAFKRTIRVSATTYQDNVGGMDFTYGDPQGLREPYAYWDFKSIDKKLMLIPEPKSPFPFVTDDGKINSELKFDHGYSFPRLGWTITPVIVIEAIPKIKHIYGKKVLYMPNPPYWGNPPMGLVDIYDRQLKMWKCSVEPKHTVTQDRIEYGNLTWGIMMHDLQTGHTSINPWITLPNIKTQLEELNLTKLLQMGR